ncbi:MAG: hypothetical protein AB7S26_00530 [Sandaracinaceae bacterium]
MTIRLLALSAVLAVGCAPNVPSGIYVCDVDADCPPQMTCRAGLCFGGGCLALTCADRLADCGTIDDTCGGTVDCGACAPNETCDNHRCGCAPVTCGDRCGSVQDGCGGILACPACPMGETCGGGGTPDVCGMGTCVARSCEDQGFECDTQTDGCGNSIECGECPPGVPCVDGHCTECIPETCGSQGYECGVFMNRCGDLETCGHGDSCDNGMPCRDHRCCPDVCAGACGEQMDPCNSVSRLCACCDEDPSEPGNGAYPGDVHGLLGDGVTDVVAANALYRAMLPGDRDVHSWSASAVGELNGEVHFGVRVDDLGSPGAQRVRVGIHCSSGIGGMTRMPQCTDGSSWQPATATTPAGCETTDTQTSIAVGITVNTLHCIYDSVFVAVEGTAQVDPTSGRCTPYRLEITAEVM